MKKVVIRLSIALVVAVSMYLFYYHRSRIIIDEFESPNVRSTLVLKTDLTYERTYVVTGEYLRIKDTFIIRHANTDNLANKYLFEADTLRFLEEDVNWNDYKWR